MPKPKKQSGGQFQSWFVHKAYETHSEVWELLEVEDGPLGAPLEWYLKNGFRDRSGRMWVVSHYFYNVTAHVPTTFEDFKRFAYDREVWYLEL